MAAAPAPPPPALLLRPAGRCLPPAPRGTNITARPAQRGRSPRPAAGKGGGAAARRTPTRPTPRSSRPGPAARITCPAAANRLRPLPPAEQPGCRGDAAPARAAEGRALLSRAPGGSGQPVRAGADRSEGRPPAVPGSLRMEAPRSSVTAPSRRGMVGRCRCKTYKTLNISEQLSSTLFGLCKLRPFPSFIRWASLHGADNPPYKHLSFWSQPDGHSREQRCEPTARSPRVAVLCVAATDLLGHHETGALPGCSVIAQVAIQD